jgi:3-oxoadipate enol-lactonase
MEFFAVNGVKIAGRVTGDPDAMPLVLLHGAGSDKSSWDAVAPAFASTHRVYAVDLRGFGESGRPGEYSFAAMCDDVLGLLDLIDAARVDVVGHSMGGSVAWLIAQAQPERVAHLVIEDSPLPKPGPAKMAVPARPAIDPPYDWDALAAIVAELNDPDPQWWERIALISARTLMLAGGASSHVPQHLFDEALTLLRDGRLTEIPVGHQIHRDAPDRFVAAVAPFLAQ